MTNSLISGSCLQLRSNTPAMQPNKSRQDPISRFLQPVLKAPTNRALLPLENCREVGSIRQWIWLSIWTLPLIYILTKAVRSLSSRSFLKVHTLMLTSWDQSSTMKSLTLRSHSTPHSNTTSSTEFPYPNSWSFLLKSTVTNTLSTSGILSHHT